MNIGKASQLIGLEPSALRFYEQAGVVPEPERSTSGYRVYREGDLDLLRFVKRARSLGMSLDDIRSIVALRERGEAPCEMVREIIATEARSIERRIEELRDLHGDLIALQERAAAVSDDWPDGACVCHIVENAP